MASRLLPSKFFSSLHLPPSLPNPFRRQCPAQQPASALREAPQSKMDSITESYHTQNGDEVCVINYSYTDLPWKLLLKDIRYFFTYAWALPWILWPLFTYGSGELDELYPTQKNMFCVAVHFFLAVNQLGVLLVLPLALLFPLWAVILGISGFVLFNWLLCRLINGKDTVYYSDPAYAEERPEHAHEQWVFLNGVSVGEHWLKCNINRLAITFKRPVLGIHNRTSGIIFDIFECLIQRNFSYATYDIRLAYRVLKGFLYDPEKTRVIFILHSQGGIEGGLVLDWLLQEIPQDLLTKLEIYTFGNAANHFNNPHRHEFSQKLTQLSPSTAKKTLISETTSEIPTNGHIEEPSLGSLKGIPTISHQQPLVSTSHVSSAARDRAIGHIEHYAHTTDFVAIWGVLHFATHKTESPEIPRFIGRLFARSTRNGGHQLNQHYLNGMFPLKKDAETGSFVGADEDNQFMEEVVEVGQKEAAMNNTSNREAFGISYGGSGGFGSGVITTPVRFHGDTDREVGGNVRVKDLSRLWKYRNGKIPQDRPKLLVTSRETRGLDESAKTTTTVQSCGRYHDMGGSKTTRRSWNFSH